MRTPFWISLKGQLTDWGLTEFIRKIQTDRRYHSHVLNLKHFQSGDKFFLNQSLDNIISPKFKKNVDVRHCWPTPLAMLKLRLNYPLTLTLIYDWDYIYLSRFPHPPGKSCTRRKLKIPFSRQNGRQLYDLRRLVSMGGSKNIYDCRLSLSEHLIDGSSTWSKTLLFANCLFLIGSETPGNNWGWSGTYSTLTYTKSYFVLLKDIDHNKLNSSCLYVFQLPAF